MISHLFYSLYLFKAGLLFGLIFFLVFSLSKDWSFFCLKS
ncbi:hypothetical protein PORCRE_1650 [Porphyromonas crevioricanis JCM 15906]|uniref:Uncharacterized protein n=1 Tax=Porphyromonas crevioricanis JCM 15906 TaxID=1305617 RepID=T1DTQ1_9PORP|nr:hypothetical protein PORCRE_1650 [Porphyromonas crevioricanis JCM 15906]GAD08330.1 hypothetical protein PORCAN_1969 [Porphyromonas crevioricanis JCM 13913]